MLQTFDSFTMEVLEKPFYLSDGSTTSRTAKVSLLNIAGKEIENRLFGLPSLEDIYERIGDGSSLCLDNCYIPSFSLTACRRFLLQDKHSEIEVKDFSARDALFFSPFEIDFTFAKFSGKSFDVRGTTFVGSELSFASSTFQCSKVFFNDMHVKVSNFVFAQAVIQSDDISFKNSRFGNCIKDFHDTDFGNGQVSFINTDFGSGDISFVNTQFNDSSTSFKVCQFGDGKCDFRFAKFGNNTVSFDQADFGIGRIDFRNVDFGSGRTSFNRCAFSKGEVTFDGAEVKNGKITFLKSHFGASEVSYEQFQGFGSELVFDKVVFPGNLTFFNGIFKNLVLTSCQFNGIVNLHIEQAEEINLSGCIARDIIDFYSHGESPKLNRLRLTGFRLLGKLYVQWDANNLKGLIYSQHDTDWADKSDQFRVIKENFSDLGRYDDEDKAYVELMRCRQKNVLKEDLKGNVLSKLTAHPKLFFKMLIFDWMGLYATSPNRVISSIIVVQILFAGLFSLFTLLGIGDVISSFEQEPVLFLKSLYIGVITFFTVGYGEFVPIGYSRVLSGILGFMGVFLMSYFTVAFVRKILR